MERDEIIALLDRFLDYFNEEENRALKIQAWIEVPLGSSFEEEFKKEAAKFLAAQDIL